MTVREFRDTILADYFDFENDFFEVVDTKNRPLLSKDYNTNFALVADKKVFKIKSIIKVYNFNEAKSVLTIVVK